MEARSSLTLWDAGAAWTRHAVAYFEPFFNTGVVMDWLGRARAMIRHPAAAKCGRQPRRRGTPYLVLP